MTRRCSISSFFARGAPAVKGRSLLFVSVFCSCRISLNPLVDRGLSTDSCCVCIIVKEEKATKVEAKFDQTSEKENEQEE
mmetsp:Transcript_8730/g.29133  ORF Transcript_8730/g.29133 Transcript_8730/m.29133 type:complete len:80 (-) Transcript_8730:562-801(-)